MNSDQWEEIKRSSRQYKERGDCGVRALAVATGRSYDVCHAALRRAGRKNRAGTYESELIAAARDLGFAPSFRRLGQLYKRPSMKKAHEHGRIGVGGVFACTNHWAGWDGHQVVDWSDGTKKRIYGIWDMFPAEE